MRKRTKKKRSLRGKILLSVLYLFLCSLMIVAIRPIVQKLSNNTVKVGILNSSKYKASDIIYDNKSDDFDNIKVSYEREQYLVSNLLSIVGKVPYIEGGTWNIDETGKLITDGIDTYGLVELAYYIAKNKDLEDVEINQDNILNCEEVSKDDLRIGDLGISILPGGNVYGVYIGDFGSYPLFIYACGLSDINHDTGSVYISYDKNVCNDIFAGMYPIAYDKYIRLPGMDYKSELGMDIAELIPEEAIPPQYINDYTMAIYRIGEWLRTQDVTNLLDKINTSALEKNGLYLDDNAFNEYINSYNENIGLDNYIFMIDSYTTYDNFVIVSAEIIDVDKSFKKTGTYFISTIYDDGSYLPAPEVSLDKYALLYGFRSVNSKETEEALDAGELVNESKNTYEEYGFIVDHSSIFKDD